MYRNSIILLLTLFLFISHAAAAVAAFKLPESGQNKCYQDVAPYAEIPCAGTGQDGEYIINPKSYIDNGDGTVTDNNTELMWQKCSVGQNNDSLCSGTGVTYDWHQATSPNVCGSLALGGHSDWRLPTKKEFAGIIDHGAPFPGPTIRAEYFPNTPDLHYWSSTPVAADPYSFAWSVDFFEGGINGYPITNPTTDRLYVRCVRGGQTVASLVDNGNGTVTDNRTGLTWQQVINGSSTWGAALTTCNGLSLGGHSDWRLPSVSELESLTDDSRFSPCLNSYFFPGGAYSLVFWTSTTVNHLPDRAWWIFFYSGSFGWDSKSSTDSRYSRCVRGGQGGSLGDVNKDMKIDLADALLDLQIVVGLVEADNATKAIGDVFPLGNGGIPLGDGSVDVRDTITILRRVVGLITW